MIIKGSLLISICTVKQLLVENFLSLIKMHTENGSFWGNDSKD